MTASDTTSTTLSGIGVSPGLVAGPVARMAPPIPDPEIATLEPSREVEKECERIALAAQQVKKGLELSAAEAKAEARTLLETTAQMAADPTLTSTAQAMVREKRLVPERAVWESAGTLATMLESLGGYMAERTRDVQDVRDRIVAVLTESPMPGIPRLPEPFVLVATDLAPADTALLDPEKVIAFITSEGGPTSHTAILARALGMPAIVGTGEEVTDALTEGDIVLGDMFKLYRYENWFYQITMSGKEVRTWLEYSASKVQVRDDGTVNIQGGLTYYDVIYGEGFSYVIDPAQPQGSRIVSMTYHGEEVADDAEFTVVINNYRYNGGGDYVKYLNEHGCDFKANDESRIIYSTQYDMIQGEDKGQARNLLADYIREAGEISPSIESTWSILLPN